MQTQDRQAIQPTTTFPTGELLAAAGEAYPHLTSEEADQVFLEAVSDIPTQSLPRFTPGEVERAERNFLILVVIMVLSFLLGSLIGILTTPTVTVDLVPAEEPATLTTPLDIPARSLAPVTLSTSLTVPTTGHGHQDAHAATGRVTLYNGSFTPQKIAAGTRLNGKEGVTVVTDAAATIPADSPPVNGQASVSAHALVAGSRGNIPAFDLNSALSSAVFVENLQAFTSGSDARDYQAVAQADLDRLNSTGRNALMQRMPQAFILTPREQVTPTACVFRESADHGLGQEAQTVTEQVTATCKGIAYRQDALQRAATKAFTLHTRPGAQYELDGVVRVRVARVSPLTVRVSGRWVYVLSQDDEQWLAQQIAGDSPRQATAYLLHTGYITRATVPGPLPKDPGYIRFAILVGL